MPDWLANIDPVLIVALIFLGWFAGTYGTIIGAGGGFIMVPALFLFFGLTSQEASALSLTVMVFAAISGNIAYARQRRIDYRAAIPFAIATLPGAWLGAVASDLLQSRVFGIAFALLLWSIAEYLMFNPERRMREGEAAEAEETAATEPQLTLWQHLGWGRIPRRVAAQDQTYAYEYDGRIGLAVSPIIGFISAVFGIGGGLIFVPILVQVLRFPIHIATSTAFFILMITALGGSVSHAALGHVRWEFALPMAVGLIAGGQTGAFISRRLSGGWIVRGGAVGLAIVSVRLLLR